MQKVIGDSPNGGDDGWGGSSSREAVVEPGKTSVTLDALVTGVAPLLTGGVHHVNGQRVFLEKHSHFPEDIRKVPQPFVRQQESWTSYWLPVSLTAAKYPGRNVGFTGEIIHEQQVCQRDKDSNKRWSLGLQQSHVDPASMSRSSEFTRKTQMILFCCTDQEVFSALRGQKYGDVREQLRGQTNKSLDSYVIASTHMIKVIRGN